IGGREYTGGAGDSAVADLLAVSSGGRAEIALEHPREMALVSEAGGQGNLGERSASRGELVAGKLDPELALVVAESLAAVATKRTRQIDRVYAHGGRDLGESQVFLEAVVEEVAGAAQPGREPRRGGEARQLGEDCQHQPFDGEGRDGIHQPEFA